MQFYHMRVIFANTYSIASDCNTQQETDTLCQKGHCPQLWWVRCLGYHSTAKSAIITDNNSSGLCNYTFIQFKKEIQVIKDKEW